ncbi:hypothetical protein D3C81_1389930 [compost metagenome]
MVAQIQCDGAIAVLRELQRPGQQRAAIHHPAMQQDHRAAWCDVGRHRSGGLHGELREALALAEIAVVQPIVARIKRHPMQRDAIGAGNAALLMGQLCQQCVDALCGDQRRGAAGRSQPLAERQRWNGRRESKAGQHHADASQRQRTKHGGDRFGEIATVATSGRRIYRGVMTGR